VELVDRPNSLEFDWRVSVQGYRLALRLCRVVPGLFAAICCPITDCLELPSPCRRLANPGPGWTCPGRCAARSVRPQTRDPETLGQPLVSALRPSVTRCTASGTGGLSPARR